MIGREIKTILCHFYTDLVQNEEDEPNNLLMTNEEEGDNENADSMLTMEEAHGK